MIFRLIFTHLALTVHHVFVIGDGRVDIHINQHKPHLTGLLKHMPTTWIYILTGRLERTAGAERHLREG